MFRVCLTLEIDAKDVNEHFEKYLSKIVNLAKDQCLVFLPRWTPVHAH